MCDIQSCIQSIKQSKEVKKLDMDKETVQVAAIVAGTAVAVTALIVDGEIGMAVAMGMMPMITGIAGYLFGVKKCESEGGDQ